MAHSGYRTALVTGASSGLGEAFAHELAARGWRLVLVARRAAELALLAERLRDAGRVEVEVLAADLTEPSGLRIVECRLCERDNPVDLLVNAAGSLGRIGPLATVAAEVAGDVIDLNVSAVVRLTRAAVRGMVARRGGGVINVASANGFWPTPGGAVYSATKAFLISFSQSVHGEVRWLGVHVTALCPGSVRTALHDNAGHAAGTAGLRSGGRGRLGVLLEPRDVVHSGLRAVASGRPVAVPGVHYRLRVAVARVLPALARRAFYRRWGRPAAPALAAAMDEAAAMRQPSER